MNILKKILKIILWVLLTIIIIYNLYSFISLKILKKDIVSINGYSVLEVVSGSMKPTINVSDLIVINTNDKDYKKDDIVTFKDVNNSFVTHRIIDITKKGYITKGDANKSADLEYINKEKIVGKYVFKINKLGTFVDAIKSPIVLILIFVIGIMICAVISVKDYASLKISDEEKEYINQKSNKGSE